ncbi:MAG TPA: aldehyde dehydrogenase [Abditibacteriaceae bacterium]|jgi:acyl-CoA reductase-like NAD-dependent aldehyde dehydrogenase
MITSHGLVPPLSAEWPLSSLVWGKRAGLGTAVELKSPVDKTLIQQVNLLRDDEREALLSPQAVLSRPHCDELKQFCERFHAALLEWHCNLLEATQLETAFIRSDCEEVLEGVLAYVRDFPGTLQSIETATLPYDCGPQKRQIRLVPTAWGTVAVVLPQSAFLILGVTCMLNALAAGNRVILRTPLQCARSAALLSEALQTAQPPQDAVSVVLTRGKEFTDALFRSSSPQLLHYLGSSRHAASLLSESFTHAKPSIVDGEGNVWVWVAEDADPGGVAQILTEGALRYNGQTCTSINGVVLHPTLYANVKERLIARWKQLRSGNPLTEDVHVGPLMDEEQSAWCERRVAESGGTVLCGGTREGNLLQPTLVEAPDWNSELVREGLFGPTLWIAPGEAEEFAGHWPSNRFPLCAGVISPSADANYWLQRLSDVARLCINGDPSIEYIFEPWGGYPTSGVNPVSTWLQKYQRVVAIDEIG